MENLSMEVMREMATQYGTVEMSLTVAAIALIGFGCLATLSGVLTNRRSNFDQPTQEWESVEPEDQTSWTELMRQLA